MQDYVAYLAAVEFVRTETGDKVLQDMYGTDAGLALIELKSLQLKMNGFNMFNQEQYRRLRQGVRPLVYRNRRAGTLLQDTLRLGSQ